MPAVETEAATTTGQNSRQACRSQQRCVAQPNPKDGDVKLGVGIRKWMIPI